MMKTTMAQNAVECSRNWLYCVYHCKGKEKDAK